MDDTTKPEGSPTPSPRGRRRSADPAWAPELRALYQSVVDEPLPDALAELLARLDQTPPEAPE